MVEDFDDMYGRIHAEIQENNELVKSLFESARENLPNVVKRLGHSNTYFPTGLTHNGMYLGVDLKDVHKYMLPELLARMRLLYEESNGEIELLNVYALLMPSESETNQKFLISGLGILSEDLSDNGARCLNDNDYGGHYSKLLVKVFGEDEFLHRCVFRVGGLVQKGHNPQGILPHEIIRRVVVDLDHLPDVPPEYKERFEAYQEQYEQDKKGFMIQEV